MIIVSSLSTGDIINLILVWIAFAALYIQWQSHKQEKKSFEIKIASIEEMVFRLENEKKERASGDKDVFRVTSDLDNLSRKARLLSYSVLTDDMSSTSLILTVISRYINETQKLTDDGKLLFDSIIKACESISARSHVSSKWSEDYSKLLDQDPKFLSERKIQELNDWHDKEIETTVEKYGRASDHLKTALQILKKLSTNQSI